MRDLEEDDVDKEALREYRDYNAATGMYGGGSSSIGGRLLTRRRPGGQKVMADLEKLGVHTGPGIANVVNSIDTWTLGTGKLLRSYPLFRMGFVLYLLVLHLWVLFIIGWQTHALEDGLPQIENKRLVGHG